jgi:hypothetical protein
MKKENIKNYVIIILTILLISMIIIVITLLNSNNNCQKLINRDLVSYNMNINGNNSRGSFDIKININNDEIFNTVSIKSNDIDISNKTYKMIINDDIRVDNIENGSVVNSEMIDIGSDVKVRELDVRNIYNYLLEIHESDNFKLSKIEKTHLIMYLSYVTYGYVYDFLNGDDINIKYLMNDNKIEKVIIGENDKILTIGFSDLRWEQNE